MQFLDDSGIESEDKVSSENTTSAKSISGDDNDLDVIFSGDKALHQNSSAALQQPSPINVAPSSIQPLPANTQLNTCRLLQRKLELKVERAKRAYSNYQEENQKKNSQSSLIPINRLSIPGNDVDLRKPLVDYKSESEESEEVSFFPSSLHKQQNKYVKLSDTFSLQEMTIESDSESHESPNLELLTPKFQKSFTEYLRNCFCLQHKI